MPPPSSNFETLQNILTKRKGLKLEVSSSGALAASLDKCIVRSLIYSVPSGRFVHQSILPVTSAADRTVKNSIMLKKETNQP